MPQRIARNVCFLLLIAVLVACEGPVGPQGPEGPAGPQGPQGPGPQRLTFIVRANSLGNASQVLPAIVGTDPNRAPALICLTSDQPTGSPWLLVAFDDVGAACGVVFSTTTNTWTAVMIGTAANWYAQFIVIF